MISCTQFIPAYSELFTFLEDQGGYEAVLTYWRHVSDTYVEPRLGESIKANGISGCYDYWAQALNEEAANFTMTLNEDKETFEIKMHHCPSKGRLMQYSQITPYPKYCLHCDTLYRRVAEKYDLQYEFDCSNCDKAQCCIRISK